MMTIPLRGFWDQHRIFSLLLVLFLLILSIFGTFHNLFCTFLSIFCPILSIFLLFFVHFLPNLSCFCIFCPSYFTKVHESKGCSVDVPGPTFCLGDNFWVEGKRPNMATFLTPRSLLLLEHLGWTKEDMDFFLLPVDDLDKSEKFEHLCWFIAGMTIVNW